MHHHYSKISINGILVFTQSWIPENVNAQIILIHGYAEHSSRYSWFAHQLSDADIALYTYDLRGHGKSSGRQAYVKRFNQYIQDFIDYKKSLAVDPNVPTFLMGHSMGGLIACKYILDQQPSDIAGVLLSGAALKVDPNLSPILQKISGVVSVIAPKLRTIKLDPSLVCTVAEEVEKYKDDPLVYHGGTYARTGAEMLQTIQYVQTRFDQWRYPVLIMHGEADQLIDPTGSQLLYEKADTEDKKLLLFKGFYHEILNEAQKDVVVAHIKLWIKQRL